VNFVRNPPKCLSFQQNKTVRPEHYRCPGGYGHRRLSGGIFHKITAENNAESKIAPVGKPLDPNRTPPIKKPQKRPKLFCLRYFYIYSDVFRLISSRTCVILIERHL
jgi:hypothetical protein